MKDRYDNSIPSLFLAALIEQKDRIEERLRERDERIGLDAEMASSRCGQWM